jgi:hypothetical protein
MKLNAARNDPSYWNVALVRSRKTISFMRRSGAERQKPVSDRVGNKTDRFTAALEPIRPQS